MKTYALIVNGLVSEIIPPYEYEGEEIPIDQRYTADIVARMVDITDLDPQPQQNWAYDGTSFAAPVPYQPTAEEITTANANQQAALLTLAAQAMAPILVSLQLGDATDAETVTAKAWQAYYRALKLVDVTVAAPSWPVAPA